jgi:alcohol dehydrogenase
MTSAAALPLAGLTALQALRDELKLRPGQRVLVTGGAGGVGTLAIQIAKWLGATVVTTASPRGADLVRSLGADEVVDYTQGPVGKRLWPVDALFDLVGGATLDDALDAVRRGGKAVSINGPVEPLTATRDLERGALLAALFWVVSLRIRRRARRLGVGYRYLFMRPSGSQLAELAGLVESGTLRIVVDRVFPFEQALEALAYLESGRAKGKVVVRVAEESEPST